MLKTLARQVYYQIKEQIGSGRYLPGARLYEEQLAKEFDVSLTPVREAMKLLESEGIVVRKEQRSLCLRTFSFSEALNVYELRGILEPAAIHLAAKYRDEMDLSPLHQLIDKQEKAVIEKDMEALQKFNLAFHIELARLGRNQILVDMIERIWEWVPLLRAGAGRENPHRPIDVTEEHREIVRLLLVDFGKAAEMVKRHVGHGWESVKSSVS